MTLQYVEEWLDLTGPKRPDIMWLPVEMSQTPLQLLDFVEPREVSFLFCFFSLAGDVEQRQSELHREQKESCAVFQSQRPSFSPPPKYSDRERFRERDKISGGSGWNIYGCFCCFSSEDVLKTSVYK